MNVDIMIDCQRCGSQSWILSEKNQNLYRFKCSNCYQISRISISDKFSGYDCVVCQSYKWKLIDKSENHYIFECYNCGLVAEFWLSRS